MKKTIITFFLLCLLTTQTYAYTGDRLTINTTFRQTVVEEGHYNIDGTIFLPLVTVCEAMGSVVFENDAGEYFIISRNGDVITHSLNTDFYVFNGNRYSTPGPSVTDENGRTLVPVAMIENIFCVLITYGPGGSYINQEMQTNYYNGLITNLMKFCLGDDFYPENFLRYYRYYSLNPQLYPGTVIKNVNLGLDLKYFDNAVTVTNPESYQVLVNKLNRLPENYSVSDLVTVDNLYSKNSGRVHQLRPEAYGKYAEMYDVAAKDGLQLKIVSSYRTEPYQRNLYNSYVNSYGFDYAEKYSAHPGFSEHQTGLAVDINSLYTSFENSKEYAWLKNNAHKFGFIERYQKGKEYITGYAYEPWHYRYVGVDAATTIYEQSLTYEEYYALYVYQSPYTLDKDRTWANVTRYYHN